MELRVAVGDVQISTQDLIVGRTRQIIGLAQHSPFLHPTAPHQTRPRPSTNLADVGQILPKLGQLRPNLEDCCRLRPKLGQSWPGAPNMGQFRTDICPTLAEARRLACTSCSELGSPDACDRRPVVSRGLSP